MKTDWQAEAARLGELGRLRAEVSALREALCGIIDIGKRDMSNPKYDGYFDTARALLAVTGKGQQP